MDAKVRDITWDLAKGFCIVLMVIGHCPILSLWQFHMIESFHMPFFFFAAGVFYREKNRKELAAKSAIRLLKPLVYGTTLCALICILMKDNVGAEDWLKALLFPGGTRNKVWLVPNWPNLGVFWFLAALFWCRIIYNEVYTLFTSYAMLLCLVTSFFFAFISHRLILPFGICEGCTGLVFYAFGHFAKSRGWLDKHIPISLLILFLVFWIIETRFVSFQMFKFNYDYYYPLGVLFACCMLMLISQISRMRLLHSSPFIQELSVIGSFSLEIMCCHQVVRTIISSTQKYVELSIWGNTFILVVGTTIISTLYIYAKTFIHSSTRI